MRLESQVIKKHDWIHPNSGADANLYKGIPVNMSVNTEIWRQNGNIYLLVASLTDIVGILIHYQITLGAINKMLITAM